MKIVFSAEARSDLIRIGDRIAEDSPLRARDFVRALRARAHQLADTPLGFPLVPRYEHTGIRRRVFRNYLIFYRVGTNTITVIHILHGAQDFETWLPIG